MSVVNSIANTHSISWIRRRKAAQETTANSQTGIHHFCYCFEQKGIEKHLRIQSTKLLKYLNPLSPKIKLVFSLTELEDTP